MNTSEKAKVMELTTSWKEEGIQEEIHEGSKATRIEDIHELLSVRFGSIPPDINERISAQSDEARLKECFRLAATVPSRQEFARLTRPV